MSVTSAHQFPGAIQHSTPYFGYPYQGNLRRVKPTILGVVHVTDGYGVAYPGPGKSWTFCVDRDGTAHQFLDPFTQAPWTNGDIQSPDTSNPVIAAMSGSRYNPNELCLITIENVGRPLDPSLRLTAAQLETNRRIFEWGAKLSGLPMDRTRIIGHYQINGVSRVNCPTVPADRARVFGGVLAQQEEDEMAWISKAEGVVPYVATVDEGANTRPSPDFDNDPYTLPNQRNLTVVAEVQGAEYPAGSGNTTWKVYQSAGGGFRVFHSTQQIKATPLQTTVEVPTGISQAQLDAARLNARDEALREALAAVQSII